MLEAFLTYLTLMYRYILENSQNIFVTYSLNVILMYNISKIKILFNMLYVIECSQRMPTTM